MPILKHIFICFIIYIVVYPFLGIAYILKLLDQYEDLDSLHWFQSVTTKCHAEKTKALNEQREGKAGVGKDEKLVQTLSLKTKRLNDYKRVRVSSSIFLIAADFFYRNSIWSHLLSDPLVFSSEQTRRMKSFREKKMQPVRIPFDITRCKF